MGCMVLYRPIFDVVRDFLEDEAFAGQNKVLLRYLKPDLLNDRTATERKSLNALDRRGTPPDNRVLREHGVAQVCVAFHFPSVREPSSSSTWHTERQLQNLSLVPGAALPPWTGAGCTCFSNIFILATTSAYFASSARLCSSCGSLS
jgi:hypothetical protein